MQYFNPILVFLAIFAGIATYFGLRNSAQKKNSFGLTPLLSPLGIFVWGDAITIGPFWLGVAALAYITQEPHLLYLCISLFWLVRAHGEVQYWLHEQFVSKHRNAPSSLLFNSLFQDQAVWFGYQTFWQCVMVFAGVASVAFAKMWLSN